MTQQPTLVERIENIKKLVQKAWIVQSPGSSIVDYDVRDAILHALADCLTELIQLTKPLSNDIGEQYEVSIDLCTQYSETHSDNQIRIDVGYILKTLRALHLECVRLESYKSAYESEAQKFQQETRRTSELSTMLFKTIERLEHQGCKPGVWSKGCITCQLVMEAKALLDKPINVEEQP